MKKKLLVFAMISWLPISSWSAFDSLSIKDYPTFTLQFDQKKPASHKEAIAFLDEAIYKAVDSIKEPIIKKNLQEVFDFLLQEKLQPGQSVKVNNFVLVKAFSPSSVDDFLGSADVSIYPALSTYRGEITVNETLLTLPLYLRWILLHEVFGHFSQYLKVIDLHQINGAAQKYADFNFMSDLTKLTHPSAVSMEVQFYRNIPKEFLRNEILESQIPQDFKDQFVEWIEGGYERVEKTPRYYVSAKARREAGFSNTVISDEELNLVFEMLKERGLDLGDK